MMIERRPHVPQSLESFSNIAFCTGLQQSGVQIGRRVARRVQHFLLGLEGSSRIVLAVQSVGY